jgi:hypothetical protein
MCKLELALHPDKSRLICFGRHAAKQREKLGEGKPESSTSSASRTSARGQQMGLIRHRAQDDQEAYASWAAGHQDRVAQDNVTTLSRKPAPG